MATNSPLPDWFYERLFRPKPRSSKRGFLFIRQLYLTLQPRVFPDDPRVEILDHLKISLDIPGGFQTGTQPADLVSIIEIGHHDRDPGF